MDEDLTDLGKIAYYEKRYGKAYYKNGKWKAHWNWYDWMVLIFIILAILGALAYKADISACQDFVKNISNATQWAITHSSPPTPILSGENERLASNPPANITNIIIIGVNLTNTSGVG